MAGLAGARSFDWTYDSADRITSMTYPTGTSGVGGRETVSNQYDAGWRQQSSCSSLGDCYIHDAQYTALDQPQSMLLGNGLQAGYAYNNVMARLSQLLVGAPLLGGRS